MASLNGAYDDQRANLRMQIIGRTVALRSWTSRCSLWQCPQSTVAPTALGLTSTLREEGATREQVNDLIRMAATLGGVAQGIQLAEALG